MPGVTSGSCGACSLCSERSSSWRLSRTSVADVASPTSSGDARAHLEMPIAPHLPLLLSLTRAPRPCQRLRNLLSNTHAQLVIELTRKMHRAVKRHGQTRHPSHSGAYSCQPLAERGQQTCGSTRADLGYWLHWSFLRFPRSTWASAVHFMPATAPFPASRFGGCRRCVARFLAPAIFLSASRSSVWF